MPIKFSLITFYVLIALNLETIGKRYDVCVSDRYIPADTVIQATDFSFCSPGWSTGKENYPADQKGIVGHKTLKPIPAGKNIELSDISK